MIFSGWHFIPRSVTLHYFVTWGSTLGLWREGESFFVVLFCFVFFHPYTKWTQTHDSERKTESFSAALPWLSAGNMLPLLLFLCCQALTLRCGVRARGWGTRILGCAVHELCETSLLLRYSFLFPMGITIVLGAREPCKSFLQVTAIA